jgi:hypothetical protein
VIGATLRPPIVPYKTVLALLADCQRHQTQVIVLAVLLSAGSVLHCYWGLGIALRTLIAGSLLPGGSESKEDRVLTSCSCSAVVLCCELSLAIRLLGERAAF